jgi:hypothetical protein
MHFRGADRGTTMNPYRKFPFFIFRHFWDLGFFDFLPKMWVLLCITAAEHGFYKNNDDFIRIFYDDKSILYNFADL